MRVSLRDTLSRLCAEIGWSYAVFWRTIWRGNSRHLVWLEGHFEMAMAFTSSESIQNWGGSPKAGLEQIRDFVEKTMKSQVHVAGDGVVGQAAITGLHQWITNGGDACRFEVMAEMNHQFALGIMTIAVIPILPHGVVQLGSTQMIPEDIAFVELVRLHCLHTDLSSSTQELRSCFGASALVHDPSHYYSRSQIITINSRSGSKLHLGQSEQVIVGSIESKVGRDGVTGIQSSSSSSQAASTKAKKSDIASKPQCGNQSIRFSPSGFVEDSVQDPIANPDGDLACVLAGGRFCDGSGSSGDSLFEIMGAEFMPKNFVDVLDSPTSAAMQELNSVFDPLEDLILDCNGVFSDSGPDQLLDAVISKTPLNSTGSVEREFDSQSTITRAKGQKSGERSVMINHVSLPADEVQPQYMRTDDPGRSTRKRARPGDGSRPRPKDRQMIQDRVKELREIVPNGAKCSIDALLEKTIRHMLFLQSVTKHADMLKETGEPKIISDEGSLLLEDKFDGGATWAYELGSRPPVCPIIVEDLHPPRRLLVEMLCEERGFFLEIADLIRGLGLTILRGVMEARKDKVWARFAVEANRDVTRMDIFMSLMRLLEPAPGNNTHTAADAGVSGKATPKWSITEKDAEERLRRPISMDMIHTSENGSP